MAVSGDVKANSLLLVFAYRRELHILNLCQTREIEVHDYM